MEKYVVPLERPFENPKPIRRPQWSRSFIELNGRSQPGYRHSLSGLLTQSYSEIGAFPHLYHIDGAPCLTHVNWVTDGPYFVRDFSTSKLGVSALNFDNKGIYLVSVTRSGCLTVHDFETVHCQSNKPGSMEEHEAKIVLHLSLNRRLDSVQWNPANQDEVVCTSTRSNELLVFDIGYVSSKPSLVLRTRPTISLHGSNIHKGLSDIAFTSNDDSRFLACDTYGVVNVWDRRVGTFPCLELATNSCSSLNSIQLNVENQIIWGASKQGSIYMWDQRGGRTSSAFQSHKEKCLPPITSLKLASLLEKIGPLKAQSDIVEKEIHSISFNPYCPYQLAFHLDDGWSGVLDIYNLRVTHIHCPPPAWLNESNSSADLLCLRKPSWLPMNSIYVVGSSSDNGIYLLDFYPDPKSPSHVDFNEDVSSLSGAQVEKGNRFVPSSDGVIACAVHPLNGTIVAGTKHSSLLMISQRLETCKGTD